MRAFLSTVACLAAAGVAVSISCSAQEVATARWSVGSELTTPCPDPLAPDSLASLRYQDFFDASATLDYRRLLAYRAIEDAVPAGVERRAYYNVLALLEAYVGNVAEAIAIQDRGALQPTTMMVFDSTGTMREVPFTPEAAYAPFPDSLLRAAYDSTALTDVLSQIPRDVRVLGLNEAHTAPLFRSTLYAALPVLRQQGFDHLALETLYDDQTTFDAGSHPERMSGFFAGEPVMGDVIRRAKDLGFTLVSYDAQGAGSQLAREEQSYETLIDRTFRATPDARVVLYAGHSHTWKTQIGPIRMLGLQLKDGGRDPLVIHQSGYYERNAPAGLTSPTLYRPRDAAARADARFDYLLVLPRTREQFGRPSWLWQMDRVPVALDLGAIRAPRPPFLVEAFIASEPRTSVPLDRIEVRSLDDVPHLALRSGAYRVRVTDAENNARETDLRVESPEH
ncbi:MAG: hypothetical protein AAGK21_04145 [Bacteroidota bacterium]